nr:MAG TPA: hypothetical protein [Bacteriophage sp.]
MKITDSKFIYISIIQGGILAALFCPFRTNFNN